MVENIIKIQHRKEDLLRFSEYWEKGSYQNTFQEIKAMMTEKNGYPPLANTKFIREGSFRIKASTSIDDLKKLAKDIRNKFGIDCFQISIDRKASMAFMLFNWVKPDGTTVAMNHITQIKFGVFILQELNLPRPSCTNMWLRYFLTYAYEKDQKVFKKQLNALYNGDTEALDLVLIRDILLYAEGMCEGQYK